MWWSDAFYRIHGHDPRSVPASVDQMVQDTHPTERATFSEHIDALFTDGVDLDVISRIDHPDGSLRHIHRTGRLVRGGGHSQVRGTALDVSATRVVEHGPSQMLPALVADEARYRLLAENAWDVIWTMALDGSITYVSPAVQRVRGITPSEAASQSLEEIHPPASAERVRVYYQELFAAIQAGEPPPTFRGEQEYYRKDGSIMIGELEVKAQLDSEGGIVQILGVTRDISERKRLEAELKRMAVTDPLTGVHNRRHADEILAGAIKRHRRYKLPACLLLIDIDHFKSINDRWGHVDGDAVLVELARRISDNVRDSDMLARWGGEEFLLLVEHCTVEHARVVAEKLQAVLGERFETVGRVSVSIGIADLRTDHDLDSWIRRADSAMYAAKAAGRNSIRVSE
jgi:diguanylate cyclase (GGDEF)-like protein/PAS domain S-box-containing protein